MKRIKQAEDFKVPAKPITITLPGEPAVGTNILERLHWATKHARNKELSNQIFGLAWKAGWRKNWEPFKKVQVVMIGWKGDRDNCVGGTKGIVDGLVDHDIIKDDNPKYCDINYSFEAGEKAVRLELEP